MSDHTALALELGAAVVAVAAVSFVASYLACGFFIQDTLG